MHCFNVKKLGRRETAVGHFRENIHLLWRTLSISIEFFTPPGVQVSCAKIIKIVSNEYHDVNSVARV